MVTYLSSTFLKAKLTDVFLWCAHNPNTIFAVNKSPDSGTFATFFGFFWKVRSSNLHILKSFVPLGDQSLSCSKYFKLANQWRRSGMKMKDPASLDPCHFFFLSVLQCWSCKELRLGLFYHQPRWRELILLLKLYFFSPKAFWSSLRFRVNVLFFSSSRLYSLPEEFVRIFLFPYVVMTII